jgi:hypothetical protein
LIIVIVGGERDQKPQFFRSQALCLDTYVEQTYTRIEGIS